MSVTVLSANVTTEGMTWQQKQSSVTGASQHSGSVDRTWTGLRSDMDALVFILGLVGSGLVWTLSPTSGPCAELRVQYPIGEDGSIESTTHPITTEWAISTPCAQVPKTEHPLFTDAYGALKTASESVADAYNLIFKGDYSWKDRNLASSSFDTVYTSLSADRQKYLKLAYSDNIHGKTGVYRGEPVLHVVDRYQGIAPYGINTATVNAVYTDTSLKTALRARAVNKLPNDISSKIRSGEWLCESVEANASSDGSRVNTQTFRWAPQWDPEWYTDRV
jgi:hypothetical protein